MSLTDAATSQTSVSGVTTKADKNSLVNLASATIFLLWIGAKYVYIPYTVNIILLVTCILYVACHRSLSILGGSSKPNGVNGNDDIMIKGAEVMRKEDAQWFPVVGSVSLFTLYLAFKFLNKDLVNYLISFYFAMIGCFAITASLSSVFDMISPIKRKVYKKIIVKHPLPEFLGGESPWDLSLDCSTTDILAFLCSLILSAVYIKSKHWLMNNLMAISFCMQGIEKFSLGTYKIGAILLVGLFFYDIFWVFGTDVMVTVAKSLDGPIKILFPRTLIPNAETNKIEFSLLGLGDIVIPGFFISLLLRFDAHRATSCEIDGVFPKPYFHTCLIAYVFGLGLTLFIMIYFEAAQPALLYLVPACLGSSLGCAWFRGEVKELFEYSEDQEPEEDNEAEEKNKQAKKDE